MPRSRKIVSLLLVAAILAAPGLALAKAGSGSSMGSRGTNTYSAPAPTNTAPGVAAPMQRSVTPQPAPVRPLGAPMAPARSGLFGGGFMSGLMGGLIGAGIGGMLFGGGMFHGISGFGGFLGFLLQIALVVWIGRMLMRMFMRRAAPAVAGGMPFTPAAMPPATMGTAGGAPAGPVPVIGPADYQQFEQVLRDVQAAWTAQDVNALRHLATPEMVGDFAEQLAEQTSRGVRNSVSAIRLDQGDLSEAWSEPGRDYATVAMRFSMVDVTQDATGRIVDGSPTERTSTTEIWTFLRAPGGRWLLSAIQQTR